MAATLRPAPSQSCSFFFCNGKSNRPFTRSFYTPATVATRRSLVAPIRTPSSPARSRGALFKVGAGSRSGTGTPPAFSEEGNSGVEIGGEGGGRGREGSGGGPGGGGDGDSQGDSEEGDGGEENIKMSGMSMSQKLTLGYAALVGVGGLMGYIKSGSQKSLAAGGFSALLLYFVYRQLPVRPAFASSVGFGLSAALLAVMGSRFKKSGKIFPAGVVSVISFVMVGGYFHGILRSQHA